MSATTGQPSGCGPSGGVGRNGGGGGGSGGVGPCGACKFLRRKCVAGCMFAPYFNSEEGATHFAMVHKVFGASNVTKLLQQIPEEMRMDAVFSFFYEAQARVQDPTYGCVSHILALQQQVASLQREIKYLQGHFSAMQVPIPPPQPMTMPPPQPTMANLVPAYSIQPPLGVSPIFFGPTGQEQHNQSQMQAHNPMGPTHFSFNQGGPGPSVGNFQAPLARDLVQGQAPGSFSHVPNNGHSSVPPGSG